MWLSYLQKMFLLENIFLAWKNLTVDKSLKLSEDNIVLAGLSGFKRERSGSMVTEFPSPKNSRYFY